MDVKALIPAQPGTKAVYLSGSQQGYWEAEVICWAVAREFDVEYDFERDFIVGMVMGEFANLERVDRIHPLFWYYRRPEEDPPDHEEAKEEWKERTTRNRESPRR